jgi:hypothetical protein
MGGRAHSAPSCVLVLLIAAGDDLRTGALTGDRGAVFLLVRTAGIEVDQDANTKECQRQSWGCQAHDTLPFKLFCTGNPRWSPNPVTVLKFRMEEDVS